jgi:hypothetical protein
MKNVPESRPRIVVCPDCAALDDGVTRRSFLKTVSGTIAAGAAAAALPGLASAAEKTPGKTAETYVKHLFDSLTEEQRKIMHFPFDHELGRVVRNNWDIVDPKVGSLEVLYTPDQQEMVREILKGITTEDGYERYRKQMQDDAGGLEKYTCAIFGQPGEDKFQFVLTGRHCTLRADGNSVDGRAFGGPIFYGHAVEFDEKPDHPGNVWWHQSRLANEMYAALDGKQREKALLTKTPDDNFDQMKVRGSKAEIPGLGGEELSADQKDLLKSTVRSMLSMFRESSVDEAVDCIQQNGGIDKLRVSFYKDLDLGSDGMWDNWRVEGPAFVWHFRGAPHVHVWVNVAHRGPGDPVLRTA